MTRFVIVGNTVFDEATLQAQISRYVGQSLTLSQLYDVANVLTRFYQAHDYGLARATVPAQPFKEGTVKLQVIEGRIGKISVAGNVATRTSAILRQAAAVRPGSIYTNRAVSRAALLVNDLAGVTARAVLVPGKTFGTSDLVFNVREKRFASQVWADNYGRPSIGQERINAALAINSLAGLGDRLSLQYTHSSGGLLDFGSASYSLPVGSNGGTVSLGADYTRYRVGGAQFGPLRITGSTTDAMAMYQYPVWRELYRNLIVGVGMLYTRSNADSAGNPIVETRVRRLEVSAYYDHVQASGGYYSLAGKLFTNGKRNDGSAGNNGESARLLLTSQWQQPLSERWRFINKLEGQWSRDPLVDGDKYSLGGPESTRGFLPAEQRGDDGVLESAELQRALLPNAGMWLGVFFDSGKVWNKATATAPSSAYTLSDVGLDWSYAPSGKPWHANIQWAVPTGGYMPSDGKTGGRLWASLGIKF
ncbi:MAG: ShlB/FhaC/HecB family hemolysin secretion/activation protein [Gammaproteobacteria bacterium]